MHPIVKPPTRNRTQLVRRSHPLQKREIRAAHVDKKGRSRLLAFAETDAPVYAQHPHGGKAADQLLCFFRLARSSRSLTSKFHAQCRTSASSGLPAQLPQNPMPSAALVSFDQAPMREGIWAFQIIDCQCIRALGPIKSPPLQNTSPPRPRD